MLNTISSSIIASLERPRRRLLFFSTLFCLLLLSLSLLSSYPPPQKKRQLVSLDGVFLCLDAARTGQNWYKYSRRSLAAMTQREVHLKSRRGSKHFVRRRLCDCSPLVSVRSVGAYFYHLAACSVSQEPSESFSFFFFLSAFVQLSTWNE